MMLVANHRATAKTGAQMSVSREESGNTTDGGQDKRPQGAARLGDGRDIVVARISPANRDVREHGATSRTRQFRNLFNKDRTVRGIVDEQ